MSEYEAFDIDIVDPISGFPRNAYDHKWANHHKNFVVAFFLSTLLVMTATIILMTSSTIGNTAHVLYPVTTDLSYETVVLNYTTNNDLIVYYNRELDYGVIGYVDITIMLCVSLGLDLLYFMQVMYTSNFHIQQVPIISTVSVWKWINYGVSGGVVLLMCALVVGVNDLFNLIYIQLVHVIISGCFYTMERRNASLLRRLDQYGRRMSADNRNVKWNYVIFPIVLLVTEFLLITVYFVYLIYKSSGFGHIWFAISIFFISQTLFVTLAIMTIHAYYSIAVYDRVGFSMMIPRAISRMFVTLMAKLLMFICIVVVSATDLPLKI